MFFTDSNNMKDRIKQIMEAQHMTQQTFAAFIGISAATLSSIFQGRTKPTLNIVEAIKRKMPNIQTEWLMFGNGTMLDNQEEQECLSSTPKITDGGEQMLNFGDDEISSANGASGLHSATQNLQVSQSKQAVQYSQAKRQPMQTNIICNEKERRCITEIRVFYDDQTWESFVPKK